MPEFFWFVHLNFYNNPLILFGLQGMDEDKGPQIRKLYVEVGHAHFIVCLHNYVIVPWSVVPACKCIILFFSRPACLNQIWLGLKSNLKCYPILLWAEKSGQ